jgi:hypothetical protein
MMIESFKYKLQKCLFVEVILKDLNGDSNSQLLFTHKWHNMPFFIIDEDVEAFLRTELWGVVRGKFPEIVSFGFTLTNYEMYYKRVGAARIHMNGNDYKFTINDDGQWEVACRRLNSGTIQDYSIMFSKLNELSNTIQGQ